MLGYKIETYCHEKFPRQITQNAWFEVGFTIQESETVEFEQLFELYLFLTSAHTIKLGLHQFIIMRLVGLV